MLWPPCIWKCSSSPLFHFTKSYPSFKTQHEALPPLSSEADSAPHDCPTSSRIPRRLGSGTATLFFVKLLSWGFCESMSCPHILLRVWHTLGAESISKDACFVPDHTPPPPRSTFTTRVLRVTSLGNICFLKKRREGESLM